MAAENLGFVAMNGIHILIVLVSMIVALFIPGYLLSLAIFPKKKDLEMGERVAISIVLGIAPAFLLMLLNLTFELRLNIVTDLIMFIVVCAASIAVYIKRGGNLRAWQGV